MVPKESMGFSEFPYLNDSTNILLFRNNNNSLTKFINTYYQFLNSLYDAVSDQHRQRISLASSATLDDEPEVFGIMMFYKAVEFFISKYAIICLISAIGLDKLVISRTLSTARNNTRHNILLPNSVKKIMNILSIMILIYSVGLPWIYTSSNYWKNHISMLLFTRFCAFILSYATETTTTILSNQLPLDSSDYSIFELALQCYWIESKYEFSTRYIKNSGKNYESVKGALIWDHIPDITVALLSRLIIHIVELFEIRKYRLLASVSLNFIHLGYMGHSIIKYGNDSVPFIIKLRHFPKVFCTLISLLSLFCYTCAIAVRWNPFDQLSSHLDSSANNNCSTDQLQYHTFINNWWNHLNLTGEEDFSMAIAKLANLLSAEPNLTNKNYKNELPSIRISDSINNGFKINQFYQANVLKNIAHYSEKNTRNIQNGHSYFLNNTNTNNISPTTSNYDNIIQIMWNGIGIFSGLLRPHHTFLQTMDDMTDEEILSEEDYEIIDNDSDYYDENTEGNYIYEEDEDYIVSDTSSIESLEYVDDQSEHFGNSGNGMESLEDLNNIPMFDILDDHIRDENDFIEEAQWIYSTRTIMTSHLTCQKRITRYEYSAMHIADINNDQGTPHHEETESICAVCKTNERCIILWPCKCFAICETCRVSLALRGYKTCVCCRRPVFGFSKVHS